MTAKEIICERVDSLRGWALSRINHCKREQAGIPLTVDGEVQSPYLTTYASSVAEQRALEVVIRLLDGDGDVL